MIKINPSQETQEKNSRHNLVELTGTENQVAQAGNIRLRLISMCLPCDPKEVFWDMVNSKPEAEWWIDHRYIDTPMEFIETL